MELLDAAPHLRVLDSSAFCEHHIGAMHLLQGRGVFAPLRVRALSFDERGSVIFADTEQLLALAERFAEHVWLTELEFVDVPLDDAAALDAVVDAALTRRLVRVSLLDCSLSPASVPALSRLVGGGALNSFIVRNDGEQLFDEPTAALIADAIRANETLTSVTFSFMQFWRTPAAAALLLGALTAHPSVRAVCLQDNIADRELEAAVGIALAALVAANAPALEQLNLGGCLLGDAGMRALFEALPRNTHLRTLDCSDNDITEAFARDVLLPAVRANTSLQLLRAGGEFAAVREAEQLVARRAGA
jgi:hypothetical protein